VGVSPMPTIAALLRMLMTVSVSLQRTIGQ
jgi:hypothetical protein